MGATAATFQRSTHQVSCKIHEEVAILHTERAIYFGLQGVGAWIWDALEQPRSVADLCASIEAEFEVSPEECRTDVVQILANLREEGLVDVVE